MRFAIISLSVGAVLIVFGFGFVVREVYLRNTEERLSSHELRENGEMSGGGQSSSVQNGRIVLKSGDEIMSVTASGSVFAIHIRRSNGNLEPSSGGSSNAFQDELWFVKGRNGIAQRVAGQEHTIQ